MAQHEKTKLRLEIAHVLFIDIVGYSRRSINQQRAAIDQLNDLAVESDIAVNIASPLRKIFGRPRTKTRREARPSQCGFALDRAQQQ
jgi:hypothetical protein